MIKKFTDTITDRIDVICTPNVAAIIIHELCHIFEKEKLRSLRGKTPSADDVEMVRGLLDSCGARQAVSEEANAVSVEAMKKLHTLPKNKYRDLLEELAVYLLSRNV